MGPSRRITRDRGTRQNHSSRKRSGEVFQPRLDAPIISASNEDEPVGIADNASEKG
jgi:hypothetical protein